MLSIVSLYQASFSFLFKIITWNLSVLTIILFCFNQCTADSNSCSKVFKSLVKVLQAVMVLSSAKLCMPDFLMYRNKSLRNILKKIGPNKKVVWNTVERFKSIKTGPIKRFLSSVVFQFSMSLIKTWFAL